MTKLKILATLIICVWSVAVLAQNEQFQKKHSKVDSTLTSVADSTKRLATSIDAKSKTITDSISRILNIPQQAVNRIEAKINSPIDSVINKLEEREMKLDDNLNKVEKDVDRKANEVQDKAANRVDNVTGKVDGAVTTATDGNLKSNTGKLPGSMEIPKAVDQALPNIKLDHVKLPNVETALPKLEIKTPDLNEAKSKITNAVDIDTKPADDVKAKFGKVESTLDEAKKYEKEIVNIKENGLKDAEQLPKEIEKRVGQLDEVKALNAENQKLLQYQDVVSKYKDKKLLQQEMLRKSKVLANEKLNKFAPVVQQAQATIGKAKKINPLVQSFKDITKKRPNEIKGKPFRQRFSPGISLQTYKGSKVTFDVTAVAAYRLSGRLTSGLGYSYKVSVSDKNPNLIGSEGIKGYRFFTDFKIHKSIFVHGDVDALSLDRIHQPSLWETKPTTVYGSYFGLGKYYMVSKRVKGAVMALYRVNYKGEVPGLSKVNLRIQLCLDLRKGKKLK
jgi:hypothetical protein